MAEGKSKFRLSFLVLGFSLVAALGVLSYGLWKAYQRQTDLLPKTAFDPIVKALRTFHHQTGKFPATFAEIEGTIWHHKQPPNFGDDGRSLSIAHYYYSYYQAAPGICTIWAIPIDKRRQEGSTFFVVLTPDAIRRWKGAPLGPDDIRRMNPIPSQADLAVLGLTEQPPIQLKSQGVAGKVGARP
jgi:hypothetical protein